MSYSVVFKSVVFKSEDGRVILFSRQGCNNDNFGRRFDEFVPSVFESEQAFTTYASGFQSDNKPIKNGGEFELKICGRPASYYDYGEHLKRALKRAKAPQDFKASNSFGVYYNKDLKIMRSLEDFVALYDKNQNITNESLFAIKTV